MMTLEEEIASLSEMGEPDALLRVAAEPLAIPKLLTEPAILRSFTVALTNMRLKKGIESLCEALGDVAPNSTESVICQASRELRQGNRIMAIELALEALRSGAEGTAVPYVLLQASGGNVHAEWMLEEHLTPSDWVLAEALARLARREYERAIPLLESFLEDNVSPDWLAELARALRLSGSVEKSLETYERSLAMAPRHFDALCGRAKCLDQLARRDAYLAWQEAFEQHPWSIVALGGLGKHFRKRFRIDLSIRHALRYFRAFALYERLAVDTIEASRRLALADSSG
jgi:tetratricopeptide (TPR) repeat protein